MRRHAKAPSAGSIERIGARLRIAILAAALATLALVLGASSTLAAQTHPFEASFGVGSLSGPGALAVNQNDGSVYVADSANGGKVLKFDSAGSPANFSALGSNALGPDLPNVAQIAAGGPAGNLYVADNAGQRLAAFAPSGEAAAFSASAPYISANSITGTPDGNFQFLCGTAVDANGAIYAGDYFQGIRVYAPSGELLTSMATTNSCNLAVDSAGNLYVGGFGGNVSVWAPSSFPVTSSTTYGGPTTVYEGSVTGLAVDPADDDLYVNGGSYIAQYDSQANGNAAVGQFGAGELAGGSTGVAIDRSGGANDGDVYASAGSQVDRFGSLVTVPGALTGAATDLTPSTATLNGTVDPDGIELSECRFEYGTTSAYGSTAPCAESNASIGSGSGAVPVHADLSGLNPADYHFRLVAANANGTTKGQDSGFSIVAAPVIGNESASVDYPEASYAEAVLRGTVNPGNGKTTYYFEYGPTAGYGETTPARELEVDIVTRSVLALVSPLDRGATYHFRLVANNAAGTTTGADQVFTTQPAAPADSCANAEIRAQQHAQGLVNCRAYEMVSPPDKGGNAVDVRNTVQATPDGEAAAFSLPGAAPGAATSVIGGYYVSRRSASSWQTEAIESPQANPESLLASPSLFLSNDLSRAVQVSREALTPGAIQDGTNMYLRDNLTKTLSLGFATSEKSLMQELASFGFSFTANAATSDLSHFVFGTTAQLLPDAAPGAQNVYELADGELRLVNYLPGGSVDPEGSGIYSFSREPRPVSADGRIVYFQPLSGSLIAQGPLYARIDGSTTKAISVSHRPGDPSTPQNSHFGAASRDGKIVYFTSSSPLTTDASTGGYANLYRYDLATDQLTNLSALVSPAEQDAEASSVNHVSADGSYAYFTVVGQGLQKRLYVAHNNSIELVADLAFQESLGPVKSVISQNGRYLEFTSYGQLTSTPVTSANCKDDVSYSNGDGNCVEIYLYDAVSKSLRCMSCEPVDGELYFGDLSPQAHNISYYTSRTVLNDGRAFFNSYSRLVPEDVNQQRDVYEWDDGGLSLISSGKHSEESSIAEVSADGRDVFFFTSEPLVAKDIDKESDLYDARIGGGLTSENDRRSTGSLCEGEGCRGGPTRPPAGTAPVTSSFEGPPSAKPKRQKQRHKSKKKRRHAKKKQQQGKKHQNQANGKRGGHR